MGWSRSFTCHPKRAAHSVMIASIVSIFAPISARTFSAGRPFGSTMAGALRPPGMRPNPTTTQVSRRCAMVAREAAAFLFSLLSQIPGLFLCRSDTDAPTPPTRTTFREDASSIARWTSSPPPSPDFLSTFPGVNPRHYSRISSVVVFESSPRDNSAAALSAARRMCQACHRCRLS